MEAERLQMILRGAKGEGGLLSEVAIEVSVSTVFFR